MRPLADSLIMIRTVHDPWYLRAADVSRYHRKYFGGVHSRAVHSELDPGTRVTFAVAVVRK